MRLKLTLFDWPPLASHLACLLAGVSIANLSPSTEAPAPDLPRRSIILTVSTSSVETAVLESGQSYIITKTSPRRCVMLKTPATLLAVKPQLLLRLPYQEAKALPEVMRLLRTKEWQLVSADLKGSLPLCHQKPRITYGRHP